jgi:hypothetical protein
VVYGIGIVIFLIGIAGSALGLVMYGVKRTGGNLRAGLVKLKDYVKWTMVTWQAIVQVGKRTAAGPGSELVFGLWLCCLSLLFVFIVRFRCWFHGSRQER